MIHIVFQPNDIDVLKKASELDAFLQELVGIADDLSVGPVKDIFTQKGGSACGLRGAAYCRGAIMMGWRKRRPGRR